MSLQSDALLAATGIFPKDITPKEHAASEGVVATWTKRLTSWVKSEDQGEFVFVPPKKDLDKVFETLAKDLDAEEVGAWFDGLGAENVDLQIDYVSSLGRAREYIIEAWPKYSLEGPTGPKVLPLSHDDAAEVWSLLQIVDDPDRLLDEMGAWTLTMSQAAAFTECYPDLYKHANKVITMAMTEKSAKDPAWDLGLQREAILRTFRGLAPETPQAPAVPPPAPAPSFTPDAEREKTQGDITASPRSRK
jgi:hypothetical protein